MGRPSRGGGGAVAVDLRGEVGAASGGHQFVTHLAEGAGQRASNPVDGHDVPVPHFGLILTVAEFADPQEIRSESVRQAAFEPQAPRLILLDEPSLGLAPLLVQQIFAAIRALNERDKLTVFLVEQNAYHALKLAHRGYVMVNGEITLQGEGRDLLQRPEIRAAYLEGGTR